MPYDIVRSAWQHAANTNVQQSRKIGWKFAFKSVISNQNWIRRTRSAGLNSTNN